MTTEKTDGTKTGDVKTDLADLKDIVGAVVADAPAAPVGDDAAGDDSGGEEAAGEVVEPPVSTMPLREQELDPYGRAYATGRRKDAVARVWLKPGKGKITVNGRDSVEYFARPTLRLVLNQVFVITDREDQFDIMVTVKGGGLSGQAGAVKHGISQAICKYEPVPDPR